MPNCVNGAEGISAHLPYYLARWEQVLSIDDIYEKLPHRYPFLMVDKYSNLKRENA